MLIFYIPEPPVRVPSSILTLPCNCSALAGWKCMKPRLYGKEIRRHYAWLRKRLQERYSINIA
jgi:hypothetical protein